MCAPVENKAFLNCEVKAINDDEYGSFEGIANYYGYVDSDSDVIESGAFASAVKDMLSGIRPKALYQHDSRKIAGVITEMKENSQGLYIKGKFINTPLSQQVREEVKSGALNSFSVGFIPQDVDRKGGVRYIKAAKLLEVSFVTFPANDKSLITAVKCSKPTNEKEFEKLLREVGFSISESKAITCHGFNKISKEAGQCEADSDDEINLAELKSSLVELTSFIKGETTHDGANKSSRD